jgi:hypothetical protein
MVAGTLYGNAYSPCHAVDLPGELLLFPEVTAFDRFDLRPDSARDDSDLEPAIDLFYAYDHQRFRFLIEGFTSPDLQALLRVQAGWRVRDTTFWLGRFQNLVGYWNNNFHHGAYMMTSVRRPGGASFEDEGGPLPSHLVGLLIEGNHAIGQAGLGYSLGLGAGPELGRQLESFDFVDPRGSHRFGATARLVYQPMSFGPDELGISVSYTEIPSVDLGTIRQVIVGLFGDRQFNRWHTHAGMFYLHNASDSQTGVSDHGAFNAYGQIEWQWRERWTLFTRLEGTLGEDGDPYLARFRDFVEDRVTGGVRLDLPYHMALKLEASREHVRDDEFSQVMLQWSAAFP